MFKYFCNECILGVEILPNQRDLHRKLVLNQHFEPIHLRKEIPPYPFKLGTEERTFCLVSTSVLDMSC